MIVETALNWLSEKGIELLSGGIISICKLLAEQSQVFIVGALIGAFFLMIGNKKTGNKITSTSILLYVILKVIALC